MLEYSDDTSHIKIFPTNPSVSVSPLPNQRNYFILSECLLSIVEQIRCSPNFGFRCPFLIDNSKSFNEKLNGLKSNEILEIRDLYQNWWNMNKNVDWKNKNPLEGTNFQWY